MEKRRRNVLITLILLELLLVCAFLYILFFAKQNPQENLPISEPIATIPVDKEEEVEKQIVEEEETEMYVLKESAWLPPWYFSESFNSLKKHGDILGTVNPVFYGVNSNGTLLNRKPTETAVVEFLEYCIEKDIAVIPTIGSYSYEVSDVLFSTESTYVNHIGNIIAEVDKYNYDGIDIDYEKIRRERKNDYINFLRELSIKLKEREKVLSVTVFAQWGDNVTYENHSDTIYVQDFSLISDIADQVRVMTYDYTLSSSPTPGPIGPIDWMEDVLKYTLTKVSKEKIWLGAHLYGYRWKDGEVTALTATSFKSVVTNPNIKTEFNRDIAEGYAQYGCDSTTCYLYYQTKEGIELRRALASKYQIAGVSYWSLGRDDGLLLE
ncbi:MAG: glycosyl hydrolase family 18 protein [Candidatus Dojkabacteria bacterium]